MTALHIDRCHVSIRVCMHCLLLASAPFPSSPWSPPPPPAIYPCGSYDHQHSVHRPIILRDAWRQFQARRVWTVCELPSHSSDSALTRPRAPEVHVDNNDDDETGWGKTTAGDEADAVDDAEDDKLWTQATFTFTNSTYSTFCRPLRCG